MHPLHLRLADRSLGPIGAARDVAAEIARDPGAFAAVVDGLAHPDLAPGIVPRVHVALDHPAPSVRARARRLCARLDRHGLG